MEENIADLGLKMPKNKRSVNVPERFRHDNSSSAPETLDSFVKWRKDYFEVLDLLTVEVRKQLHTHILTNIKSQIINCVYI